MSERPHTDKSLGISLVWCERWGNNDWETSHLKQAMKFEASKRLRWRLL